MRDKFIRFMKDHRAYEEWIDAIAPLCIEDIQEHFIDGCAKDILADGFLFYYSDNSQADWQELHDLWEEIAKQTITIVFHNAYWNYEKGRLYRADQRGKNTHLVTNDVARVVKYIADYHRVCQKTIHNIYEEAIK